MGDAMASFSDASTDVFELLCKMLRFDTTNPPGNEKPLAEMLASYMKDRGIEATVSDLGDNRANVTGCIKGSGERKALMLNGHLDVVPTGLTPWDTPPFDPVQVGDKLFGRGASDMKGGLAAMIVAAAIVKASNKPLKGDLIITGSADEEAGSLGARAYREQEGLDDIGAIIVGEPSSCCINISEKGALWIEVITIGKTAHGAFADQGINAVVGMHLFIGEILQYKFEYTANELLGHPSLNISIIQGGVKANVVPDRCSLTLDIRTVPGMPHSKIVDDINAICEKVKAKMPGLEMSVNPFNDRPAVETPKDHPFIKMAQSVIADKFGGDTAVKGVNFYTDAAIFLPGTDIPAILYGPGDASMAHQPNECVSVPQLSEAVTFYVTMIERYLVE